MSEATVSLPSTRERRAKVGLYSFAVMALALALLAGAAHVASSVSSSAAFGVGGGAASKRLSLEVVVTKHAKDILGEGSDPISREKLAKVIDTHFRHFTLSEDGRGSLLRITFFDPERDAASRRVIADDGVCDHKDQCVHFNYARMGGPPYEVWLNARSWMKRGGFFGNRAGQSQSQDDYRYGYLLPHELGHALESKEHVKDAGKGKDCHVMTQASMQSGSEYAPECNPVRFDLGGGSAVAPPFLLSRNRVGMPPPPSLAGGATLMATGSESIRKLGGSGKGIHSGLPIGRNGSKVSTSLGKPLWRVPTNGRGSCLIEAYYLAIVQQEVVHGSGSTFGYSDRRVTEPKNMRALARTLTADNAASFRQRIAEQMRAIVKAHRLPTGTDTEKLLKDMEAPMNSSGRPDGSLKATWFYDETIELLQRLGIQMLFINREAQTVFCRSAVGDHAYTYRSDGTVQKGPGLTMVILWEGKQHFTLLARGVNETRLQTVFKNSDPLIKDIFGAMVCKLKGDRRHVFGG